MQGAVLKAYKGKVYTRAYTMSNLRCRSDNGSDGLEFRAPEKSLAPAEGILVPPGPQITPRCWHDFHGVILGVDISPTQLHACNLIHSSMFMKACEQFIQK